VAAHADGTPTLEEALPTDTATVAIDEVVPEDGSPVPEVVLELNTSTAGGADAATSARVAAVDGLASSSGPTAGAPSSPPHVAVNDNIIEEPMREPEVILGHRKMSPSLTLWACPILR
jgi:hypothetical protein